MARGKKTTKRADVETPLRLTRLRSLLAGAPPVMQGLDRNSKTTEALPRDPDAIPMAEVRNRLPRTHPLCKPKIRIILHPSHSPPSPPPKSCEPPAPSRKLIRLKIRPRGGHSGPTGRGKTDKGASTDKPLDSVMFMHVPTPRRLPLPPIIDIRLDTPNLSCEGRQHGDLYPRHPAIKQEHEFDIE